MFGCRHGRRLWCHRVEHPVDPFVRQAVEIEWVSDVPTQQELAFALALGRRSRTAGLLLGSAGRRLLFGLVKVVVGLPPLVVGCSAQALAVTCRQLPKACIQGEI